MNCVSLSWFSHARGRLALAAASILLALHWTAPAFQSSPPSGGAAPEPGYSSAQLSAHQGTLPRLLTRASAFEAGVKGPGCTDWPTAEEITAFRPPAASGAALTHPVRIAMPDGWRAAGGTASFDARGPPPRMS